MSTISTAPVPAGQPAAVTTPIMASPRVAIVIYTMYGHIATMAESVSKGIQSAGGSATIYQAYRETRGTRQAQLPLRRAPGDLTKFDAFIFGIPIRYGNFPAHWKNFWDASGSLWAKRPLFGKYSSVFVSTASAGGGQESTVIATLSTFTHHGMIFVPLGYAKTFAQLTNLSEVHGGSSWGAGTFTALDGSRKPTALELNIAESQGRLFWDTVSKE